jgi:cation transport ATPase
MTDRRGVAIRSAVPGRERWQIDRFRSRPHYAAAVEREVSRHQPVRHAWANPLTGRLLVVYDPGVRREEIHDRVHASLGVDPIGPEEMQQWRARWPRGFNRVPEQIAVEQARLRLILSGTLLAGVAAKRLMFGAGAFAGSPAFVTASAILTILHGYTILRRGFDSVTAVPGGLSSRTILSAITLGVLVTAESFDGIAAMAAAHAGELLEAKMIRDSRASIRVLDSWFETNAEAKTRGVLPDPYDKISTAALIAAAAAYAATGDGQRALAMLVGACPVASPEARTTARALSLRNALDAGILFRDPETISSLPRRFEVITDGKGKWSNRVPLQKKLDALRTLRESGVAPVVLAGERTNPALMHAAEIGMATVPRSSPESLHAADVVLLEDDRRKVDLAVRLMQRTSSIVRQDQVLSRLVGLGGFTAATLGKLSAAGASRLHNYTRLAMELNSLRLISA